MNKVLMKFGAEWCNPCKQLESELDKVDLGDIPIHIFDISENPEVARLHGVRSIPTLILMQDGEEIARSVGFKTAEQILAFVGD